eukprot:gene29-704_t
MALHIRRFQEERNAWEEEREALELRANTACEERDRLLEDVSSVKKEYDSYKYEHEQRTATLR